MVPLLAVLPNGVRSNRLINSDVCQKLTNRARIFRLSTAVDLIHCSYCITNVTRNPFDPFTHNFLSASLYFSKRGAY